MHSSEIEGLFHKRLTELRLRKGVSARDMSLSLGQNHAYINQIENNRTLPSMQGFFYICEYLGVSPIEFFDDTIYNKEDDLLKEIRSLNSAEMEHILLLIHDLKKAKEGKK